MILCYIVIIFLALSCQENTNISQGKGTIEIPAKNNLHLYRSGAIVDTSTIIVKKYNIFTYINASCASCLPKFEILNNLYAKIKQKKDISFYCISYSKDNFELLKFLVEDRKINIPKYDIVLHPEKMQEKPEIVAKLNITFITDRNLNILYEADLVDHPETFETLIDKLK